MGFPAFAVCRLASVTLLAAVCGLLGCSGPPYMPARTASPPPAVSPDIEQGNDFFAGKGGLQLFEQWWRPATAPPRAAIVIVHGLKDHSSRYASLAARLVDRGFAVYAFDLPGHGHSAGVRVGIDEFEDYVVDLDTVAARVRARNPDLPLFVFGHSMGGTIATLWTIERQPKLGGLVLSAPALTANVSWFKVLGTKLVAWVAPNAGVFQLDLADFSRDPAVVREAEDDPLVYKSGAPAHTAEQLLRAIDRIRDHMAQVRSPLLVMHGSADHVTDPEGSKELAARAATCDKTLRIWPGLVHDLIHEPEGASVIDGVVSWIDARVPKAKP